MSCGKVHEKPNPLPDALRVKIQSLSPIRLRCTHKSWRSHIFINKSHTAFLFTTNYQLIYTVPSNKDFDTQALPIVLFALDAVLQLS